MLDWLVKLGGLPELALAVLSLHPVLRTVTGHSLRREELPRRRPPEPAGPLLGALRRRTSLTSKRRRKKSQRKIHRNTLEQSRSANRQDQDLLE